MHWLDDLGLPNQRRWLNHRKSVTITAERYPPPSGIVTHRCEACPLYPDKNLRRFWIKLTEGKLAGSALLVFECSPDFQQAIEHFGTLGTARGERSEERRVGKE